MKRAMLEAVRRDSRPAASERVARECERKKLPLFLINENIPLIRTKKEIFYRPINIGGGMTESGPCSPEGGALVAQKTH